MFALAIDKVMRFTRPIHFISRYYSSNDVRPGAATLILLNSDGCALTCAHVADALIACEQINNKYDRYRQEIRQLKGIKKEKQIIRELERKYGYDKRQVIQMKARFAECVDKLAGFQLEVEKAIDLALIRFNGFDRVLCSEFPVFPKDTSRLKQGKFLCRIGFPFPEFTDYGYDPTDDDIRWVSTGRGATPQFPVEGMVTRNIADGQGNIVGFEMSTPGLKGQSGGPAFDSDGLLWGLQSQTGHLDLDFDVDQEVFREGNKKRVQDSAFLHVGKCVHINVIKQFLAKHSVVIKEE